MRRMNLLAGVIAAATALLGPVSSAMAQTPAIEKLVTASQTKITKAVNAATARQTKSLAKATARLNKLVDNDAPAETIHAQAEAAVDLANLAIERVHIAFDRILASADAKLDKMVTKNPDLEAEAAAALAGIEAAVDEAETTLSSGAAGFQDALAEFINYFDPTPPEDEDHDEDEDADDDT